MIIEGVDQRRVLECERSALPSQDKRNYKVLFNWLQTAADIARHEARLPKIVRGRYRTVDRGAKLD